MPSIQLSRMYTLPDIVSTHLFELMLGTIPGGDNTEHLTLKCTAAALAGESNEAFDFAANGHTLRFRGRRMQARQLAVTYVEDAKLQTLTALRTWHENIVGTDSADSTGDKVDYSVNSDVVFRNGKGDEIARDTYWYTFIQDVPDVTLNGDSTTMMQVPVTFSYDYTNGSSHDIK